MKIQIRGSIETRTADGVSLEWVTVQVSEGIQSEMVCKRVPSVGSTEDAVTRAMTLALGEFRRVNGVESEEMSRTNEDPATRAAREVVLTK